MTTFSCGRCRDPLEARLVHLQGTTANRFYCRRCSLSYQREQFCDVCKLGRTDALMATTVYRSSILGELQIRHCGTCTPRSKASMEFETSPVQALVKYALIYGVPALCVLLLIVAILAGSQH